ncbi:copper chaperone PCu(A)C [Streptomyces sp. UNOC14_S4]|uniref:copper chaperone PCu(A)C n=1 Tax=Streptomyces sp. UNOC14_S4 TaxID=2872340 RepID=UPI001E3A1E9A|nr:copper chaperone PCu(A)C [Streptomyces sp. UNOC14_S4]MCC3766816.1 copper chaperone PCu(A)C [Streptomyces sp. UNOC14_S4]
MRKSTTATAIAMPLLLAGGLLLITGCQSEKDALSTDKADLSVSGAYLPQPAMTDMAAAYLTVKNGGDKADQLTSVTSPLSGDITMHTTEGSQMKHASKLEVPANGELKLSRGGTHLMLGKLAHKPKVGEKVEFTLHFAESGAVKVQVPVESATFRPQD